MTGETVGKKHPLKLPLTSPDSGFASSPERCEKNSDVTQLPLNSPEYTRLLAAPLLTVFNFQWFRGKKHLSWQKVIQVLTSLGNMPQKKSPSFSTPPTPPPEVQSERSPRDAAPFSSRRRSVPTRISSSSVARMARLEAAMAFCKAAAWLPLMACGWRVPGGAGAAARWARGSERCPVAMAVGSAWLDAQWISMGETKRAPFSAVFFWVEVKGWPWETKGPPLSSCVFFGRGERGTLKEGWFLSQGIWTHRHTRLLEGFGTFLFFFGVFVGPLGFWWLTFSASGFLLFSFLFGVVSFLGGCWSASL